MFIKYILKKYKFHAITTAAALVAILFVTGSVAIANGGVDSVFNKIFAADNQKVIGYHDANENAECLIYGWALDPDSPEQDVKVRVYADGKLAKTLTANAYREDLKNANVGCDDGKCAWGDGFSDVLEKGRTYDIRVTGVDVQDGQEYELGTTNKKLTCGAVPPPPTECSNPDVMRDIKVDNQVRQYGKQVTARVTNSSATCSYNMGLALYKAYMEPTFPLRDYKDLDEFIKTQTLADEDMQTVSPGETATFTVDIPQVCTYKVWQADLFSSPDLTAPSAWTIHTSHNSNGVYRLFDWEIASKIQCPVEPPSEPNLDVVCVPASTTVEIGDTVRFTANPTGGNGSYSYEWSDYVTGNTKTVTKTTRATGTYTATVKVTSGGQSDTASCDVRVLRPDVPEPPVTLTGSCVANPTQANIGQSVTWTANANGGTGSYTYSWSGAVTGNDRIETSSYNSAGTKTANVTITSGTQSITKQCQTVIVTQPIALNASCSAAPNPADVGEVVTWTANATGGTGSYTYLWSGSVTGTDKIEQMSYNIAGTKTATVKVTSGSQSVTKTCNVVVREDDIPPPPLSGSCSASPSQAYRNQTITWAASASGGTGSYSYTWSGAVTGNDRTEQTSYSTVGTKTATVRITSGSQSVTKTCNVQIVDQPISLSGSCDASPSHVRTGQTVTWSADASGGNGSYTYSWSGAVSGNNRTETESYSSTGTKNATVVITSGNESITRNCQVVVEAPSLDVSCYVRSSSYEVGDTVRWSANASGGTGDYEYEWDGTNNLRGDERTVTKRYTSDGTKTARVTVTSGGMTATARCQVDIDDEPSREESLDVSCSVNPSNPSLGEQVTWRADARGGDGDYDYYWSGSDNLSSNDETVRKSYDTAGQKYGTVTVRSGRQTVSATCNVLVASQNVYVSTLPIPNNQPLSYVYLNQVPYTGLMDDLSTPLRMLMLVLWSAAIALVGLKAWNNRHELAYSTSGEPSLNVNSKIGNILTRILPGAFVSPYLQTEESDTEEDEEDEDDEADLEEEEIEEEIDESDEEVRDINALLDLSVSKKALVSRNALKSIYTEFDQNFEDASLELLRVIDNAALSYPREDGWILLNSERLSTLR